MAHAHAQSAFYTASATEQKAEVSGGLRKLASVVDTTIPATLVSVATVGAPGESSQFLTRGDLKMVHLLLLPGAAGLDCMIAQLCVRAWVRAMNARTSVCACSA